MYKKADVAYGLWLAATSAVNARLTQAARAAYAAEAAYSEAVERDDSRATIVALDALGRANEVLAAEGRRHRGLAPTD